MLLGGQFGFKVRSIGGRQRARQVVVFASATPTEQAQKRAPKVGDLVSGVVHSVPALGAHIDLDGGYRGLLHRKNISESTVEFVGDVFRPGDQVKVLVDGLDPETGRYALSTKQLEEMPGDMLVDPSRVYEQANARLKVLRGCLPKAWDLVDGEVVDVRPDRALVDVYVNNERRCSGVLLASNVPHTSVPELEQLFKIGDRVKAIVLNVDFKRLRVRLSTEHLKTSPGDVLDGQRFGYDLASEAWRRWREEDLGDMVGMVEPFKVNSVFKSSVLVQLEGGLTGSLPLDQVSKEAVVSLRSIFKKGDAGLAMVTDVDYQKRHLVLSTQLLEATPGDMLRDPQLAYGNVEVMLKARQQWLQDMVGQVVTGRVLLVQRSRMLVEVRDGIYGKLYSGCLTKASGEDFSKFEEGDTVKALVSSAQISGSILGSFMSLNTAHLEVTPGDMLRDPQLVYDNAEATIERLKGMVGQAVPFRVQHVTQDVVLVSVGDLYGALPIEEVSQKPVTDLGEIFKPGAEGIAVVTGIHWSQVTPMLSTKALEVTPGDMIRDARKVYQAAGLELEEEWSFKPGDLVEGAVEAVVPFGVFVKLDRQGATGLLHIRMISHEHVNDTSALFKEGDRVKALVSSVEERKRRVQLSTKHLEPVLGDMLRDKERVFQEAEEMAERWRRMHAASQ